MVVRHSHGSFTPVDGYAYLCRHDGFDVGRLVGHDQALGKHSQLDRPARSGLEPARHELKESVFVESIHRVYANVHACPMLDINRPDDAWKTDRKGL